MNVFFKRIQYYFNGVSLIRDEKIKRQNTQSLPDKEKSQLMGYAYLKKNLFLCKIHNESDWIITCLTIRIITQDNSGRNRCCFLNKPVHLQPNSSDVFRMNIKNDDIPIDTYRWFIEDALGYQE